MKPNPRLKDIDRSHCHPRPGSPGAPSPPGLRALVPDAAVEAAEDEAADREGQDDADCLVLVPVGVVLDADAEIEASQSVQCHYVPNNEAFEEDLHDSFVLDSVKCLAI